MSQEDVAKAAEVSARSVQEAEAGKMPKARMPYTLAPIARALDWPAGGVDSVLNGGEPPGGWQDVRVQIDDTTVAAVFTNAMVRSTENATASEIRRATQLAIDELRRLGFLAA